MENSDLFYKISDELKLGNLIAEPIRVSGGFMHKMYCLETTAGKYAVKLLNPAIMKRPGALQNYQSAEQQERVLQENKIPIVPALEMNGNKMQCIDNQYFYLFNWSDGKALGLDEIKKEHCEVAGTLLAKIHKLERLEKPFTRNELCIDWVTYIKMANNDCSEIADLLNNGRDLLYMSQKEYNAALDKIPPLTCICDGDMDSKNVLWVNGNPVIIDLECLGYGNPFMEMYQLALSWSGYELCHIDFELFEAFIASYHQEYGSFQVDWNALYGTGYGMLEWLEYNVKRSLMIECDNEEEQRLGIEQVNQTMHSLIYYNSIKDELLKHLDIV